MEHLLARLLRREGGFVNHAADKGGATKYGITIGTLTDYRGYPQSVEDVRALTLEEAKRIYLRNYWLTPRINELPELIREHVFDMAVNHGPARAIRMLQRELGLTADGACGPVTLTAARNAVTSKGVLFHNKLVDRRIAFYRRIVQRNPTQAVFLKGWLRRAEEFRVRT